MSKKYLGKSLTVWLHQFAGRLFTVSTRILTGVVVAALGAHSPPMGHGEAVAYTTGLNETRTVAFSDGTELNLDAMTTIVVGGGLGRRSLYLDHGQFQARILHGISKPLDVVVRGTLLRDWGTEFDVSARGEAVTVAVTKGKIQVIEMHPDGAQLDPVSLQGRNVGRIPAYLVPGDLARLERHSDIILLTREANSPEEAQARTSWMSGKVETRGQRLDEILSELNAHNAVQIVPGDPSVAQIQIGGIHQLTQPDRFLQLAQVALGLEAVPVPGYGGSDTPAYILRWPSSKRPSVRSH
jgi:transmembrane sensor